MDQRNTLKANNKIFSIHDPIIPTIQKLLALYIVVFTISPPLQIDTIYRIILLGAVGLWFLLNIPYNVKFERLHMLTLGFVLLIIIVALIESGGDWSKLLRPINYYLLVIGFLMAYCYKDRWHELTWLVPVVLLLLIYFNYKTYQVVLDDPTVARLIVRDDPSTYKYIRQGVGGYGLLYSQVCALPMLIKWTISSFKKSWLRFFIGIVWAVSFFLYLFNSGYTIATVTSIASLIILFFYKRKSALLAIVITAILIALLIWLIGYIDGFRNALINFFDGTKVAQKINDIYLSITTTETADSIMERWVRYQASLNCIISYPIIGGLWFPGGSDGGHSAILDTFAKYGVFGGYVFIKMIFDFPIKLKRSAETKKDFRLANAVFIAVLMVTLLNSFPYNLVGIIMFIIPVCFNDILAWRKHEGNSKNDELGN